MSPTSSRYVEGEREVVRVAIDAHLVRALEEIRRSIPRPFARVLVPRDLMMHAIDKARHECEVSGSFESRPIRPSKSKKVAAS